jgi:hypothetical protein
LSDNDLAKESENPITLRVTLPLRYEADFGVGPYNAVKSSFQMSQAVVPLIRCHFQGTFY